jgi:hypothetical protein
MYDTSMLTCIVCVVQFVTVVCSGRVLCGGGGGRGEQHLRDKGESTREKKKNHGRSHCKSGFLVRNGEENLTRVGNLVVLLVHACFERPERCARPLVVEEEEEKKEEEEEQRRGEGREAEGGA